METVHEIQSTRKSQLTERFTPCCPTWFSRSKPSGESWLESIALTWLQTRRSKSVCSKLTSPSGDC